MEIWNNSLRKKNTSQVKPSHVIFGKVSVKAAVKAVDGSN